MNESEFDERAEATLLAIEHALEQQAPDIDFESEAGILTLEFANRSKIIINRQLATREIWVAARSGGYHCRAEGEGWRCQTTGETLPALLSRVCSEQAGEAVQLSW